MKLIPILLPALTSAALFVWNPSAPSAPDPETSVAETLDPETTAPAQDQQAAKKAEIEHGRYLVHHASMCVQCHSPRDNTGKLRQDRVLMGGQIPFTSPWRDTRWAELAPNIRQMLGYTDEEAMNLLTKGLKRNGEPPRGPMPPFRMNDEDARAVIAYLRSL